MRVFLPIAVAFAACIASTVTSPARAQEYCVVCAEPKAMYRCVIGDARLAKGQPLQQFCLSTLARQGGHATCTIKAGTVFDCDAPIRKVAIPAAEAKNLKEHPPVAHTAQSKTAEPAAPSTVEKLTRKAARDSERQVEKAGSAIGSGAKKAWKCVTSLFMSC